jgi:hypothetical protein
VGTIVREGIAWLSTLILLVGIAVCALYLTRVRWAAVLMAGFALQALSLSYAPFMTLLARHGVFAGTRGRHVLALLLGMLGSAILVAGVGGVLSEFVRTLKKPPRRQ